MDKFDTHKFLFTLFHEGRIEGHTINHVDKDNNEQSVQIKSIEIGASPVSCRVVDKDNKTHRIMFVRIKSVYYKDELVWENTDFDLSDVKIIKGYK